MPGNARIHPRTVLTALDVLYALTTRNSTTPRSIVSRAPSKAMLGLTPKPKSYQALLLLTHPSNRLMACIPRLITPLASPLSRTIPRPRTPLPHPTLLLSLSLTSGPPPPPPLPARQPVPPRPPPAPVPQPDRLLEPALSFFLIAGPRHPPHHEQRCPPTVERLTPIPRHPPDPPVVGLRLAGDLLPHPRRHVQVCNASCIPADGASTPAHDHHPLRWFEPCCPCARTSAR
jgi:hypothetical protein